MSAITLYEAAEELRLAYDTLDGIEDPAQRDAAERDLAPLLQRSLSKVDSFHAYLVHLDGEAEAAKREIARLTARRRQAEARAERLREYAVRSMLAAGVREMSSRLVTLRPKPNPPSVVVECEQALPDDLRCATVSMSYSMYRILEPMCTEWDADVSFGAPLTPIGERLKRGEDVPGARLETKYKLEAK